MPKVAVGTALAEDGILSAQYKAIELGIYVKDWHYALLLVNLSVQRGLDFKILHADSCQVCLLIGSIDHPLASDSIYFQSLYL